MDLIKRLNIVINDFKKDQDKIDLDQTDLVEELEMIRDELLSLEK